MSIIRSHRKDAYFQAVLFEHLSTILRSVKVARFVHAFTTEARASADLLYLGLTTFLGNHTLGEEYCDIVQVEAKIGQLLATSLRAGYIMSSILFPHAVTRILPAFRRSVRSSLKRVLSQPDPKSNKSNSTRFARLQIYILEIIDAMAMTSSPSFYTLSIATFYFSGAYYHLSKCLFNLRYIFTYTPFTLEQLAGYEVLGVLLVL